MIYYANEMDKFLQDSQGVTISPGDTIIYASKYGQFRHKPARLIRAKVESIIVKMSPPPTVAKGAQKKPATFHVTLKVRPLMANPRRTSLITIRNPMGVLVDHSPRNDDD